MHSQSPLLNLTNTQSLCCQFNLSYDILMLVYILYILDHNIKHLYYIINTKSIFIHKKKYKQHKLLRNTEIIIFFLNRYKIYYVKN